MTETARHLDDDALQQVAPPPAPALKIVRNNPDSGTGGVSEPNIGRSAMVGYVVGFLIVAVAITVAGTLGGLGFGPSLGLGIFVGIWGGGGFGFMMGGTIPLARHLDSHSARSTHHRQGEPHEPATR
ncbi:MAG: hypothetical protein ACT4PW_13835 [Acidimicrobiia bacterium]